MDVLTLDGVVMPTPSKMTITKEKIWSKNAGRGSTGTFIGDIVAIKYKIQIEWKTLSQAGAAQLDKVVSKASFDVKFVDPADSSGGYTTKTMYAGTPTYPVYSYVNGLTRHTGAGVDLIEV